MKMDNLSGINELCPVCASAMRLWMNGYAICETCGYMSSREPPGAGAEVVSLEDIRERNFTFICELIRKKFPDANTVLDVGCSNGHFIRVAKVKGLAATGLEPDEHLAEKAKAQGHNVIDGFFPSAATLVNKKYDVIIFNDSLEHIPDLREVLRGVREHLTKNGIVIVSLPSANGLIFSISRMLYRLGVRAPFDRLWQKGFASPHLHYFKPQNLRRLFENSGFTTRHTAPLPYYTVKGLWKRISCKSPFIISIFAWLGMTLLYPLSKLKSDSVMAVFSAADGPALKSKSKTRAVLTLTF